MPSIRDDVTADECCLPAGVMRDVTGVFAPVFVIGGLVFALSSVAMLLDYAVFRRCKTAQGHWAESDQ